MKYRFASKQVCLMDIKSSHAFIAFVRCGCKQNGLLLNKKLLLIFDDINMYIY